MLYCRGRNFDDAALWLSVSTLVSISEVTLRQAWLILGWVTGPGFNSWCRKPISVYNCLAGQLSLAILLWVGTISTSQMAVMLCSWGVKAGMVREWVTGKTV